MTNRPTPVPPQECKHERAYYDEKGLRCKECHAYLPREPLGRKGPKEITNSRGVTHYACTTCGGWHAQGWCKFLPWLREE